MSAISLQRLSCLANGRLTSIIWEINNKLIISGGCQLQPLPYALQLLHKQRTVQLAYDRFSTLPADKVPRIQPTIGSPKQWGYRTKITPHFDAPPKWVRAKLQGKTNVKAGVNGQANGGGAEEDAVNGEHAVDGAEGDNGPSAQALMLKDETGKGWECKIGFERKGKPGVMDIEVSWQTRCTGAKLMDRNALLRLRF